MSYVVAYVDEDKKERDKFLADYHLEIGKDMSQEKMEIELIDPEIAPDVEHMISYLLEMKIDAVITDYKLTEYAVVQYSGKNLVDCMLRNRTEFPCFIRTNYEVEALQEEQLDVNLVYKKPGPKLERVIIQIENYRSKIIERQNQFHHLMEIDPDERTDSQIDKILELDNFLEKSLGGEYATSMNLKRDIFVGKRMKLIEESEQLIKEIRNKLDGA